MRTLICSIACLVAVSTASLCLADSAGDALLKKCEEAEQALRSLRATCYTTNGTGRDLKQSKVQVFFMKPNFARTVSVKGATLLDGNIYSNGRMLTTYDPTANDYFSVPADSSGANVALQSEMRAGLVVAPFFAPTILEQLTGGESLHIAGTQTVAGVKCRVLAGTIRGSVALRLSIGPDYLLRSVELSQESGAKRVVMRSDLSDAHANVPASPKQFAWRPPAGVKKQEDVIAQSAGSMSQDLLKSGTLAPEFKLPELHGATVALSGVVPAHKVTLINFWDAG